MLLELKKKEKKKLIISVEIKELKKEGKNNNLKEKGSEMM